MLLQCMRCPATRSVHPYHSAATKRMLCERCKRLVRKERIASETRTQFIKSRMLVLRLSSKA